MTRELFEYGQEYVPWNMSNVGINHFAAYTDINILSGSEKNGKSDMKASRSDDSSPVHLHHSTFWHTECYLIA